LYKLFALVLLKSHNAQRNHSGHGRSVKCKLTSNSVTLMFP